MFWSPQSRPCAFLSSDACLCIFPRWLRGLLFTCGLGLSLFKPRLKNQLSVGRINHVCSGRRKTFMCEATHTGTYGTEINALINACHSRIVRDLFNATLIVSKALTSQSTPYILLAGTFPLRIRVMVSGSAITRGRSIDLSPSTQGTGRTTNFPGKTQAARLG